MTVGKSVSKITNTEDFGRNARGEIIPLRVTNIHDFVKLGRANSDRQSLESLEFLIRSQAMLHHSYYAGDPTSLERAIRDRVNTFRGFIIQREDTNASVGYAVYYPMIDKDGKRAAYCEDFFIVESYRGYGVAKVLFNELAKRTLADDLEYLQWSTDKRNAPVHSYVQKVLGATRPGITTLSADNALDPVFVDSLKLPPEYDRGYTTRPITSNDLYRIEQLGFDADVIRRNGDLDFKGFITFADSNPHDPIAVTTGWKNLSTFQLKEGIMLEHPRIAKGHNTGAVLTSILDAARKHCKNKYTRLRWHIDENSNDDVGRILKNVYKMTPDTMINSPDSELIVYTLRNGELNDLANQKPLMAMTIPAGSPIGQRRPTVNDNARQRVRGMPQPGQK